MSQESQANNTVRTILSGPGAPPTGEEIAERERQEALTRKAACVLDCLVDAYELGEIDFENLMRRTDAVLQRLPPFSWDRAELRRRVLRALAIEDRPKRGRGNPGVPTPIRRLLVDLTRRGQRQASLPVDRASWAAEGLHDGRLSAMDHAIALYAEVSDGFDRITAASIEKWKTQFPDSRSALIPNSVG